MKRKSYKLARLERNRFSVFYDDLGVCCYCHSTRNITKHEILPGRNRINSMKYGFVLPLCLNCHRTLQHHNEFNRKWQKKAQKYFEEYIGTREDWLSIFRKNYL